MSSFGMPAANPVDPGLPGLAGALEAAITSRMSIRAFTAEPLSRAQIADLLVLAAADCGIRPSGLWRVHVLQGPGLQRLCAEVRAAHDALRCDPGLQKVYREAYDYYPQIWTTPYLERRRANGWGLYGLLGIGRADKDRMHAQHQRNYRCFDAPQALFMTLDHSCGGHALLECGRFLQCVMLQARLHGLHTCPQAAWNPFAQVVLRHLEADKGHVLVGAMALGHADPAQPVNGYYTPREPLEQFCRWRA